MIRFTQKINTYSRRYEQRGRTIFIRGTEFYLAVYGWEGWWNATGLEAEPLFTFQSIHKKKESLVLNIYKRI